MTTYPLIREGVLPRPGDYLVSSDTTFTRRVLTVDVVNRTVSYKRTYINPPPGSSYPLTRVFTETWHDIVSCHFPWRLHRPLCPKEDL